MPEFKFRLESLLNLRDAERQRRRLALAEAFHAESLLHQQADQLSQQIKEMSKQAQVTASPGRVDVDQLLSAHRYRLLLESQAKTLQQKEAQLSGEIERRRQSLVEADRDVRVLEKLKERKLEEHHAAELQQEVKQLDEVAIQRWRRRMGAPT